MLPESELNKQHSSEIIKAKMPTFQLEKFNDIAGKAISEQLSEDSLDMDRDINQNNKQAHLLSPQLAINNIISNEDAKI